MKPLPESRTVPLRERRLALYAPARDGVYSLEMVARLTDLSRHQIALYCNTA